MLRLNLLVLTAAAAAVVLAPLSAEAAFVSNTPDAFVNANFVPDGRVDTGNPLLGFVAYSITNIALVGDYNFFDASPARIEATYSAVPVLAFFATATSTTPTNTVTLTGQFAVSTNNTGYGLFGDTYNFALTSSTASGSLGGLPVLVRLNALLPSTATSTIANGPNNTYTVDTQITQLSEYSLDGGQSYLPLPPLQSAGVSVPSRPRSPCSASQASPHCDAANPTWPESSAGCHR